MPRRPSPTSRARRIGGRPVPRPEPDADRDTPPARQDGAATTPVAPVTTTKPAPRYEPVPEPTAEPTAEPGAAPRRGFPVQWIPAVVLAVFVVVASHGVYWAKTDNSAGTRTVQQEEVLAATKKCFAQINSYDYRKLDGLLQKDLACTTGTFTGDLRQAVQKEILRLAPQVKATQTAQVNKAGIASVSPSGNQVVTLIYGQLAQSNTKTAKSSPRLDVVGAVVTVDYVHGRWLIAKVDSDTGNSLGS